MLLEKINSVNELRELEPERLETLAREVRDYIIDIVSERGGHLASSLGVVELTLALHYIFNTPSDRLIWDVGHQTYAHKILTGRRETFATLRQYQGLSGFPKRVESPFDTYNTGHSSTSLSLAMGEAVARDLEKGSNKVIAVIGDGALTSGMAFEALNHIGQTNHDCIIILNDNEHSIDRNVGAISEYLTRVITTQFYNRIRKRSQFLIRRIPKIGEGLFKLIVRASQSLKGAITPGQLFEDMGIRYFGPVDGHNMSLLLDIMEKVKGINAGPKLIHVITRKGKGYPPAEENPSRFHGTGPFDRDTGKPKSVPSKKDSWSLLAGRTLANLAMDDPDIIAVTAAMKLGTGLCEVEHIAPERFFDVGIAEQHAITFASALASCGKKPFVSIYSTFLQRSVDQIIHDVAIMNLPVRILVDRAGIVGDDGETHHGLFDIGLYRNVPNLTFLSPASGEELRDALLFASNHAAGPVMIRYPRGKIPEEYVDISGGEPLEPGRARVLAEGEDLTILALGDMVPRALEVMESLEEKGLSVGVINILSIRPLDIDTVTERLESTRSFFTLENGLVSGGVGELIHSLLPPETGRKLLFLGGFPDEFVPHGSMEDLFRSYGLDTRSLTNRVRSLLAAGHVS